MREYDLICVGSGSAMNIVGALLEGNPKMKVAVIDKDDPGGICLTRGCIPSKILLYPAELVRTIGRAGELGIDVAVSKIDFQSVMERMRSLIRRDIDMIREGLSHSENIDYYHDVATFVDPYTLRVGDVDVKSKMMFLCTGSKPMIPAIEGLEKLNFHTSDTVLGMEQLPSSIAIVGGGFIAAEYGHFFSAMGSKVTVIGRNPQFLPDEEPEVSALASRELGRHMTILTNHEVKEVGITSTGEKRITAVDRGDGGRRTITAEEILIAVGRGSNSDILHPEKGGIKVDKNGWIVVDDYLETSQPNIWAFGDADGRYPFKHKANYESTIVYHNAILKKKVKADYHAVPHAVFTYPEIASVGLRENEAVEKFGDDGVLIGMQRYEDTAKGEAMGVKDYFAKVIVEDHSLKILGAHIIGPHASILLQEVVDLMYTREGSAKPIIDAMHIHPALSEVVERAFQSLMPVEQYHHSKAHQHNHPTS